MDLNIFSPLLSLDIFNDQILSKHINKILLQKERIITEWQEKQQILAKGVVVFAMTIQNSHIKQS